MSQRPFGFNILDPLSPRSGYPQSPVMQVSMAAVNTDSFGLGQSRTRKPASLLSAHAEVLCCRRRASSRRMEAIRFLLVWKIRHIKFSWSSQR